MKATCKIVFHRDQRRQQRHDGLARANVSLQQAVHRLRPLHVADDVPEHLFLILGQLERQDLERGVADAIGDPQTPRLALRVGPPAPHGEAQLEEEELLEDQTHLGRRPKLVQPVHRRALGRKVCLDERRSTVRKMKSPAQFLGQRVVQHGGQPL